MITPLLWAALQIAAAPSMSAIPLPTPTVHTVPTMGQLVLADSPNPHLTAVRVFVPLAPDFRGTDESQILVNLAELRASSLANRAGIRFSASLAPDGIVYSATGSNIDVDHVFAVLSRAIRAPDDNAFAYDQATRPVRQRREAAAETGSGWIVSTLSSRLCQNAQPPRLDLGTQRSGGGGRPEPRTLRLWALTHAAPQPVITVVSTLSEAVLFAGVDLIRSRLPMGSGSPGLEPPERTPTPRAPSLLRVWYGTAYLLPDSLRGEALVAGELLDEAVAATSGDSELFAEIRTTNCGSALYVWGSSLPRGGQSVRARVQGFLSGFEASFDDSTVARAANRVRFRLLANADTPAGRAAAVASTYEGRRPIDEVVEELRRIDRDEITVFLSAVAKANRVTAEVGR